MRPPALLRYPLILLLFCLFAACKGEREDAVPDVSGVAGRPNILIIYADDLGYGDTGAYGATQIQTPNIDALAAGGLRFTRAYASSATCTPSRYALLTGRYPWRKEQARILPGNAPLLIDTARLTLPGMLRRQGYRTGIVGKWHLGLGSGAIDWNRNIRPGPNDVGFDESYILAATQDRVPTVYIRNGEVVGLDPDDPIEVSYEENFPGEPTALDHPEMLRMDWDHGHNNSIVNGIPRIGFMKGGEAARWVDEDMADTFLEEARLFIGNRNPDQPFFLYYALQQPHVPRTPHPRFVGATGLGPRGDAIFEADWCVGQIMKALEEEGLSKHTLVIFSSDNGPVLNDGYRDQAVELNGDHSPWGPFRGGKYSLFEAGTRVPFIVSWPGTIEPGVSDALVSQMDLMASLAHLVGAPDPATDSRNLWAALSGQSEAGRESLVLEALGRTAFRRGAWALIPPYDGSSVFTTVNIESGNAPETRLYHLDSDPGQTRNLAGDFPEIRDSLMVEYRRIRSDTTAFETP
ncbi:arylsulfatase [Robiginitalea sp. SC105]|uniref:sulfatase family protein n=1 Tax=Robiginitalea sp. SC105 TaxID=2762332 RepID=UPI0016398AAE|nr:arylsulfatase [Robiginitalea sp. SC105]MBC2839506.1 arylsulfatase [Robiginitalea sp. SC105]